MTRDKMIYWGATGLLCAIFLMSAGMFFFNHGAVVTMFGELGFPSWIIYPLGVAKVLGVIAILSKQSSFLKEWAYAGFFFDALLAIGAHQIAQGGGWEMAIGALVLIVISRIYDGKLYR